MGQISLPDGSEWSIETLLQDLLLVSPGAKLVYATDLADTSQNRLKLQDLAHGANALFCEATFCESETTQAQRTGHLTARACGEIAAAAKVEQLFPFHFSRRYEKDPMRVYDEAASACGATVIPELPA